MPGRLELGEERFGCLSHLQLRRRQQQEPRLFAMLQKPLDRLIDALCAYGHAAVRTVHLPKPGGEHAEVVIHLRERAHGRAWRAAGAPLLDRHRGGEPLDLLEQRLRHLPHELPGIRRQALDIPPLPLGIERVEGERRLAAAARPAADRHRPAGDVGIDLFEVVQRRAADRDRRRTGIDGTFRHRLEHRRDGRGRIGHLLAADGRLAGGLSTARLRGGLRRGEHRREGHARVRPLRLHDLLGRARGDDPAATAASFGPEVDHPVGTLHDIEVVLHDEHRVARLDEPLEHREQLPHVGHVEAGRWLVEDVEGFAGGPLGQLPRQLHPLGLAARERGGRLAEVEVIETDVAECLELAGDVGGVGKELPRVAHLHVQKFGDVFALPADLERVFGKPGPAADLARHPHVRQKIHVEPHRAVALAGFAPAAGHVEAEPARLPAPLLRLGEHREQAADVVPHLHVGRRVAPRRPPDR